MVKPNFWEGKKVFVTGHTGFKGRGYLSGLINLVQLSRDTLRQSTSNKRCFTTT